MFPPEARHPQWTMMTLPKWTFPWVSCLPNLFSVPASGLRLEWRMSRLICLLMRHAAIYIFLYIFFSTYIHSDACISSIECLHHVYIQFTIYSYALNLYIIFKYDTNIFKTILLILLEVVSITNLTFPVWNFIYLYVHFILPLFLYTYRTYNITYIHIKPNILATYNVRMINIIHIK